MACECEVKARNYAYNRAQTPGLVTEVFWCEESMPECERGWEVLVWASQAMRALGHTRQIAGTRRFHPCNHIPNHP